MKRYLKVLLILSFIVITLGCTSVHAKTCADSTGAKLIGKTQYLAPGLFWKFSNKKGGNYKTYVYKIQIGGKIYPGFCIDPGSNVVSKSDCLTCDKLDESKGYGLLTKQMYNAGYFDNIEGDPHRIGIPYRFVAVMNEDIRHNNEKNFDLAAFIAYHQDKQGIVDQYLSGGLVGTIREEGRAELLQFFQESDMADYGFPGQRFLAGSTPSGESIDYLYNLAKTAQGGASLSGDETGGIGGLIMELVDDQDMKAKIKVTVPKTVTTRDYECEGCSFVSQPEEGLGKSTEFEVEVDDEDCKFKIKVMTDAGGVYLCHENTNKQQYIIFAEEGEMPNEFEFQLPTCETCITNGEKMGEPGTVNPDIRGDVNNCCDGGTTEVEEPDIDELFEEDDCYMVPGYRVKNGAAQFRYTDAEGTYADGKVDSDYCELYCTQRARIDIPGEISAVSGRYFVLRDHTVNAITESITTTGPVVQGVKRCRIRIKYADWLKEYMEAIDNEIESYNSYQEWKKKYELTEKVLEENTKEFKNHQYKVTCTASPVSIDCGYFHMGSGRGDTKKHEGAVIDFKAFEYDERTEPKERQWFQVKLKEDLIKHYGSYEYYDEVELEDDEETHEIEYATVTWKLQDEWKAAKKFIETYDGNPFEEGRMTAPLGTPCAGRTAVPTYHCTYNETGYEDLEDVDVEGVRHIEEKDNYENAADAYSAATKDAKMLENKLYVCDNYFGQYEGAAAGNMFEFDPDSTFYYTQVYLDDLGSLATSETGIDFERICKQDPTEVPDPGLFENKIGDVIALRDGEDGLTAQNTSEIFGSQKGKMKDFRCSTEKDPGIKESSFSVSGSDHKGSMSGYSEPDCSKDTALELLGDAISILDAGGGKKGFEKFLDEEYMAGKQFTMDARYHAYCYWVEVDNIKYSLAPYGDVDTTNPNNMFAIRNFNIHNKHYEVFLTTLEGTFETHWEISNIGENGVFDEYISQNGTTCAGQTENDPGFTNFTCKLKVTHQIVRTGECDGVVDDSDRCYLDNTSSESYMLYGFKVVDANNLFPVCDNKGSGSSCYSSIGYGYNWLVDPKGQEVLREIQSEDAYDNKNLSYSFILSGGDMKKIREYNNSRIDSGGYTDYQLSCKNACMGENGYTLVNGQTVQSNDACSKCYSDFISNLANGKIKINGSEQNVTGWGNKQKSLSYVREHNNW